MVVQSLTFRFPLCRCLQLTALSPFSISYLRKRDWYGDPPGAGKIWENRFYTGKMGPHWPENAQMDISTCQRPRGACQNFFSFTIQAVAVTFLKVCSQFAPRGPKFTWISSIQLISYFSLIFSTFLHHLLYSAQLWQALQEWSFCTGNTTKLWLINFFVAIWCQFY